MKSNSSSGPSESNDESDSGPIPMVERSWHKMDLEAGGPLVDAVVVERNEPPEHWFKGRSERGGDEDDRRGSAGAASESTAPETRVDEHGSSVGNLLLRRTWPLILCVCCRGALLADVREIGADLAGPTQRLLCGAFSSSAGSILLLSSPLLNSPYTQTPRWKPRFSKRSAQDLAPLVPRLTLPTPAMALAKGDPHLRRFVPALQPGPQHRVDSTPMVTLGDGAPPPPAGPTSGSGAHSLFLQITNYGISPFLIVPLVPMALFNWRESLLRRPRVRVASD